MNTKKKKFKDTVFLSERELKVIVSECAERVGEINFILFRESRGGS